MVPPPPSTVPVDARIALLRGLLSTYEWTVDISDRKGVPPASVNLRRLAESYAALEVLEGELCATATQSGTQVDLDAARAARLRMDDLCTQLRKQPSYPRQCP